MGGGKTGRGKKIPHEGTTTSSTRSAQTPFSGQQKGDSGRKYGVEGGMAGGEGANSRMQIPKSRMYSSSICEESGEERASSHKHTTTSWQCGFEWVASFLRSRLKAWDMMVAKHCECSIDEFHVAPFSFKYVEVAAHSVPHIIGRGRCIICQLETVCGVFVTLTDLTEG